MSAIKVPLEELKKAVGWMEANTNEAFIHLEIDGVKLYVKGEDKIGQMVEIALFSKDASMMPTITKTDRFTMK